MKPLLCLPKIDGPISPSLLREAKRMWAKYRAAEGFAEVPTAYGSKPSDNQKYGKGKTLIFGLSLAPSRLSGINVCRWSTPDCVIGCVAHNGNGSFPRVVRARIAKTKFLFEQPLYAAVLLCDFLDKAPVGSGVRLNTFSDLDWQIVAPWLFERYPGLHFYDYTKDWTRESLFPNYSITYSASERTSDSEVISAVESGFNVAVVFSTAPSKPLPLIWKGLTVINGDASDERWSDPEGVVVGLRAKGKMRTRSKRGMVRIV